MANTMLNEYCRPKYIGPKLCQRIVMFLIEYYHVLSIWRLLTNFYLDKTPKIRYFKIFGRKCYILNSKDYLTKFDPKYSEDIFLGYSINNKSYRVFNLKTLMVEESINVAFDESKPHSKFKDLIEEDDHPIDSSPNVVEGVIRQFGTGSRNPNS